MFSAFKRHLELLRHGRQSEDDVEPRPLLDRRALAHALDNYNQDRFPLTRYNVNMDQKIQVDAFRAALRVDTEEVDTANFAFQLAPEHHDTEEDTLVPTDSGESELATLDGMDYGSNIETMKPVDLFSLEEIFSDQYEDIPVLLIRYTDIIGSDRLAYQHDAAIYYDFCVDQIERHVVSRGVMDIPRVPDREFFCNHAVRVFLQVPDIPDIVDGPFYRYMGDCYIVKTNQLLVQHDWKVQPEYLKDGFVRRFVVTHNSTPKDNYRALNCYTPATARELLDQGNIYPLIILKQAYQEEAPFESYSPIQLNGTELPFLLPTSPNYDDSASIYSGKNAPGANEEFPVNLNNIPSPLFTDPFGGNIIITFPSGAQEIYPATRAAFAYDAEDYVADEDGDSVWSDGEDGNVGDKYDESDSGGEDEDRDDEDDYDYEVQVYQNNADLDTTSDIERRSSCWLDDHDGEMGIDGCDGAVDIHYSGYKVSESERARYAAIKEFCDEMEETSRADTPMGRVQRQFIQNMRAEMAALGLLDDADFENGNVMVGIHNAF